MIFSINYNINEVPWWNTEYENPKTIKQLKEQINKTTKIIKINKTIENYEYYDDFANDHVIKYLREVLIGEMGVNEKISLYEVENLLNCKNPGKLEKKVINIKSTLNVYFPDIFNFCFNSTNFTPQLLCEIHKVIGKGIISNAGEYRTLWAKPAQENWEYIEPKLIKSSLKNLCKFVVEELEKDGDIIHITKLAATFMTNFLHIHPFSNGNGRVARIAISLILSSKTVVPIAIGNSRNIYLDCLRESRYNSVIFFPSTLARLILESIYNTNINIIYSLELT